MMMVDRSTPDLHDLAAAYALDALDAEEKVAFETHLATCHTCNETVAEFVETSVRLASGFDTPPPAALKDRVMSHVMTTRQDIPAAGKIVDLGTERRRRRPQGVAAAAIAAALAFVIGLTALVVSEQTSDPVDVASILVASDAQLASVEAPDGASLRIVWSESKGEFAFLASDLPGLPADRTYELWFIGDADPIKAGLFDDGDGEPVEISGELAGPPAAWAVSVEPSGGSDAPTTTPIYVAEVTTTS